MGLHARIWFTAAQKAELWERWRVMLRPMTATRAVASARMRRSPERVPFRWNRDVLQIHALARVLIGEPASTSPGHALIRDFDACLLHDLGPTREIALDEFAELLRRPAFRRET